MLVEHYLPGQSHLRVMPIVILCNLLSWFTCLNTTFRNSIRLIHTYIAYSSIF